MALPDGLATVTLSGSYPHPDGSPMVGHVRLVPTAGRLVHAASGTTVQGAARADFDQNGHVSITVVANDTDGIAPYNGTYQLTISFYDAPEVSFPVRLSKDAPDLKLAAITPVPPDVGQYLLVTGPRGLPGADGQPGQDGQSAYQAAVAAGFSGTGAEWLASLKGPKGDKGDAGSGGVSIRSVTARVDDGAVQDLDVATDWTVVTTSVGTRLKATIPAAIGDRIRLDPDFMRLGSHFLDWVVLDGTGAIVLYLSSRNSAPSPEGSPSMYPSVSFGFVQAAKQFVVASNHLSAGTVTVALAHKGTGSGKVYAYPGYPWELMLSNLDPEPDRGSS